MTGFPEPQPPDRATYEDLVLTPPAPDPCPLLDADERASYASMFVTLADEFYLAREAMRESANMRLKIDEAHKQIDELQKQIVVKDEEIAGLKLRLEGETKLKNEIKTLEAELTAKLAERERVRSALKRHGYVGHPDVCINRMAADLEAAREVVPTESVESKITPLPVEKPGEDLAPTA